MLRFLSYNLGWSRCFWTARILWKDWRPSKWDLIIIIYYIILYYNNSSIEMINMMINVGINWIDSIIEKNWKKKRRQFTWMFFGICGFLLMFRGWFQVIRLCNNDNSSTMSINSFSLFVCREAKDHLDPPDLVEDEDKM